MGTVLPCDLVYKDVFRLSQPVHVMVPDGSLSLIVMFSSDVPPETFGFSLNLPQAYAYVLAVL